MTATAWLVVLAIVLVVLAGLLTSAETAISRVSRSQVEDARKDGDRRAERLLLLLRERPRHVNVLLFLSTVAMVTATVVIGYVCVDVVGGGAEPTLGILVAVGLMVVASYVVVGVAARTLGRQHAERIAMAAAGPARFLASVLGPLASLLILIGNALTPGRGYREGPFASQAELREMVDLAEADDLIEDDERQMIHSVFELGDTFAKEVMVPRTEVVFIERSKTLRQALSLGLRSGFSRIPVIGENADDIVGIVYFKDIVRRIFEHRDAEQSERVESLMRAPYFVPDSKPADALLRDMQSARVHMAVVVDEYGGTAGLVTIEDILEEIVGEIADEYDTAAPEVTELPDGAFRVLARMHVDDFADLIATEIDSEDEGVDTVLGLVAKRLGRVPIPGAGVDIDGWRLTAEQGAGRRNRIGTVLAQRVVVPVAEVERGHRMADDQPAEDLPAEDAKLVTLARGARSRIGAAGGAAIRDETGRTYSGATVELPSLVVSALALAVVQAAAAGARGAEAAAVVGADPTAADLDVLRDLAGAGIPVLLCAVDGTVRGRLLT